MSKSYGTWVLPGGAIVLVHLGHGGCAGAHQRHDQPRGDVRPSTIPGQQSSAHHR